ncbi:hypothetical protein HG264_11805 [Pseudomonas sp. gcc21]|uniref:DUF3592 domain-containing protein n=1 Tax=Pseudomonas sp. gcc21 TaxID=2726989 RepID=UPI001452712A|nr:DUF3592 domain-containing protein [Pseudomonas sp. gcc21]QJD59543.1 hypothetical protein HG264_11805 [Pseudomonas sp. gcc21]
MLQQNNSAAIVRRAVRRGLIILAVFLLLVGSWESRQRIGYQPVEASVITERWVPGEWLGEVRELGVRYRWQASQYLVFIPVGMLDALSGLDELAEGDQVALAIDPQEPHQAIFDRLTQRYPVTLATVGLLLVALLILLALAALRRRRRRS